MVVDLVLCWPMFLYCLFFPGFDLDFLSTSQEIGWEVHHRSDLFSVEWDVKLLLQSISQ